MSESQHGIQTTSVKTNASSKKRDHNRRASNSHSVTNVKKKTKNRFNKETALSKALSKVLRHEAVNLGLAISSDGYVSVRDLLNCNGGNKRNKKGKQIGNRMFSQYTLEDIQNVVANSDKKRFRLSMRPHPACSHNDEQNLQDKLELCIRANQGHSMPCINEEELLTPINTEELVKIEPDQIIHGTYRKAWAEHIQYEGLCRMKRNHIHLAAGLPPGFIIGKEENGDEKNDHDIKKPAKVISGMRTSCDVLIFINGRKCAQDNIKFFRSDNGVILTPGIGERGMLPVQYFSKVFDMKSNKVILDQKE